MYRFHGNGPYCKILTEKEPIRAQGFAEGWAYPILMTLIATSMALKAISLFFITIKNLV